MSKPRKAAMTATRKRVAGEIVTALLGAIFGAEIFPRPWVPIDLTADAITGLLPHGNVRSAEAVS